MSEGSDINNENSSLDDFDPNALRAKYRAERAKRIRSDGNDQYVEIKGDFAHYLDDPYVAPGYARDPLSDDVEVAVIGGGFGGLLAAARLRQAGVSDIRMIEKGGDFGGAWYWNRYPGAACDIDSYIYLPLLEEVGYMPIEKYSKAGEIYEHVQRVAKHFDLYRNSCLQTEVTEIRWNNELSRWIISTNRGDAMRARFVVMANGLLQRPKLPGIPGIENFKGHSFHTSRWDYDYTGGDCYGGLTKLADKRVGLIGTGATAVQCVPYLGASAKELYVFQRTPSSVGIRNNQTTDPKWAATLKPGWQRQRMNNFNIVVTGGQTDVDLVNDGWTDIIRNLKLPSNEGGDDKAEIIQLADYKRMEALRSRVDAIIADKGTAEALKPWYNQFCKRPSFHDEYLHTFNRPNVHLVDTEGKGVEAITENAAIVKGRPIELDCLIFATGFEVGTSYTRRSGYEVYGRDGISLSTKWAKGISTLHGMHTRGFPNCLIMMHSQSGLTSNYTHILDEQAQHLAYIVSEAMSRDVRTIEVTQEAEDKWVQDVVASAVFNRRFLEECTPSYYNNEGQPSEAAILEGVHGRGSIALFDTFEQWRSAGTLEGLELN